MRSPLQIVVVVVAGAFVLSLLLLYYTKKNEHQENFLYDGATDEKQVNDSLLSFEKRIRKLYDGIQTFVLFIGYGRSGHSLVAAILDAHPKIVIAHEFDVLRKWNYYKNDTWNGKNKLFFDLHSNSRAHAMFGKRAQFRSVSQTGYAYHVAGQWQGTFQDNIKVIGDKHGDVSSSFLMKHGFQVLDEIQKVIKVPLKFIHVIRNPFDNIATKVPKNLDARDNARDQSFKVNNFEVLDHYIASHFKRVESVQRLHQSGSYGILDVYSSEIISHPRENLRKLCSFLEVNCDKEYIDAVSAILYQTSSKTRNSVVWTSKQKARVEELIQKYPFLRPFTFYSN